MTTTDFKGFVHEDASWSWPEFDDDGNLERPGHAWLSPGLTRCGQDWPHAFADGGPRATIRPDGTTPRRIVPTPEQIAAKLRPADERGKYLCRQCLHSLGLAAPMIGPSGELP